MAELFQVPEKKRVRVIIDTDAKNEADDQYAIVHALLTKQFIIKGLIGAHFGNRLFDDSMERSYKECRHILSLMPPEYSAPVYRGAHEAVRSQTEYEYSEGARLIVDEAMAEDSTKLYVIFLGPITDLACAYLAHPEIAGRLTAIWIGGGRYPEGGMEFNLSNDVNAANVIFASQIELWQVPINVYGRMLVSLTELEVKVSRCGEIGKYLFKQMVEFNDMLGDRLVWPKGETWCLGDSPAVGLMMDDMPYAAEQREAPHVDENLNYHFTGEGRKIRVYNDINNRFILEDFFCKMEKYNR